MSKAVVRGGQLNLHNLRMIKQIVVFGFGLSLLLGMGISAFRFTQNVPFHLLGQYVATWRADFSFFYPQKVFQKSMVDWPEANGTKQLYARDIVGTPYVKSLRHHIHREILKYLFKGLWYSVLVYLLISFYWLIKGKNSFLSKRVRGQRIVSASSLTWRLRLRRKASDLTVDRLPLVKNAEVKHILAVGTTGAGKTNLFNELLPQIASRQNKALIIDTTGDMIAKYYNPQRGDILLNPFDVRSASWDILSECIYEYQFDSIAKSIVPQHQGYSDPMWRNGSAKLLSVALQKAKERGISLESLYERLVCADLESFGHFFFGTDAFVFADPKGEKTTMSFRSTLVSSIDFLKHLSQGEGRFSVTKWIQEEGSKSWVFLTANKDQLPTLRPLISAVFDAASTALMSMTEDAQRRLWFILDELPALQRLQSLQTLLSQGRKYGACVFAGLQGMSQLDKEYGPHDAKTLLNLFNTKFFFRASEVQTCEQISRWIGDEEIEETQENLSYGAHEMRDGISLNNQRKQRRLLLPVEVSQLPDLMCYTQYPENFPVSKLKMRFNQIPAQHASFILKPNL